ncbi:MAG: GntR family transcriptional regulator [Acholeplasmataceae bacterium]|nr:GntR family transcriptional regulator [Acholeplasmataceae bacterium]
MKPINLIQTKDYIARVIRLEILSGRIKAGEELTQEDLAETMGVSRMPVREALQTLAQEGFLVRLPNRHMQVMALNQEEIAGIFSLVASMETEILKQILRAAKDLTPLREKINKGIEFHFALANLLGNAYIKQIHGKLIEGYVAYAIESMNDKSLAIKVLQELLAAAQNNNEEQISKAFHAYYEIYAKVFTVGGRV